MSYFSAKVHRDPGGDTLVVEAGGTVELQDGSSITGLPMAGEDDPGVVYKAEEQTDVSSEATLADVIAAFNALLAALKYAAIMTGGASGGGGSAE